MTLRDAVKQAERKTIEETLQHQGGWGRLTRVAELLGVTRPTLYRKMRRYGIDKAVAHPQERLAL